MVGMYGGEMKVVIFVDVVYVVGVYKVMVVCVLN